jgi:ABC-type iron transport system FetAB ATPase subunit
MLKARDNPFAMERVHSLHYQFRYGPEDSWNALMLRLEQLRFRGEITGPKGVGKTTLLAELGRRLASRGYRVHSLFLNEDQREYPAEFLREHASNFSQDDIVLLDGCEQLGLVNWLRFRRQTRSAGGLIITSHRGGRLPLLRRCSTDVELLGDLVGQLLGNERDVAHSEMRRLFLSNRGNLRDAFRELYDRAANDVELASEPHKW